ncbi:MAG: HAD family hydrolase, partial [Candidatus Latescibacteria bacterium]|nr:HAD family hydrolase [Candidatus Latescibacterota bacterium]
MFQTNHPVPDTQTFLPNTQIEIVNEKAPRGDFEYALFDFDGTISVLREGWPEIMAPLMVEMVSGDQPPPEGIGKRVEEFIDETTGIQTILQMEGLVEMVREYGLVPEDEIKDAQGYKAIYNERLLKPVYARRDKLTSGDPSYTLEQATMAGSLDFLKKLSERGLTLILASGTDREYVLEEAKITTAAQYFNGGMFGALKTFEEYSKDKVIKQILADFDLQGGQLMVFGDGPVELRNAKDNGAVAVGVASDEVACRGWNMDKRD